MIDPNNPQQIQEAGMRAALKAALKLPWRVVKLLVRKFFVWLIGVSMPIWVPLLVALGLGILLYFAAFCLPKFIVSMSDDPERVVIYYTGEEGDPWTVERDEALYSDYLDLNEKWLSQYQSHEALASETVDYNRGNASSPTATVGGVWGRYMSTDPEKLVYIVAPREQAQRHIVPWAVMGAIDRMLGDPIMHDGTERIAQPDIRFDELEPTLTWTEFELYYYKRWTEYDEEDEEEKTYTKEYKHKIKLLHTAKTYEADFTYEWQEKVIERRDEDVYEKIIIPEYVSVARQGPYYIRVQELLAEYGLTKELDTETVLQLAAHMDEQFTFDAYQFSSLSEYGMDVRQIVVYDGPVGHIAWPTTGTITSNYGMRYHPIHKTYRMHTGIDIANARGTEIRATANGIVVYAKSSEAWGKSILINHGEYCTFYAHLDRYLVKAGQEVNVGDPIGLMGSTGWSTGPHLHFEVRRIVDGNTVHINPISWLP